MTSGPNDPSDPADPAGEPGTTGTPEQTPARVGCALPFILGGAVVVGMVLLFLYLLVFW